MTLNLPKKMVMFLFYVCVIIPRCRHWMLAHTLQETSAL